ncbi:MAG: cyclic nucleotide-binding domain-containing protein [Hyphomicrobiales bacterium]
MEQHLIGAAALVHIAGVLQVGGYLSRDQLVLRFFLLAGSCFYLAYYFVSAATPLWEAILWSGVIIAANLYVMVALFMDRRHRALTPDEQRLISVFSSLSPGQFRRLMKAAKWITAVDRTTLTLEGKRPDSLFFVLDGDILISKAERRFTVASGVFIGEIAWLLGTPATATVEVSPGARYVEWDTAHLRSLLTRFPDLRIAFEGMLNRDLAGKLGKS